MNDIMDEENENQEKRIEGILLIVSLNKKKIILN